MTLFSPYSYGSLTTVRLFLMFIFFASIQNAYAQDIAPVVTATGQQTYCPGNTLNIATTFNVSDADDTGAIAAYIQISSGYVNGQDILSLTPTTGITATWNATSATLTLKSTTPGAEILYTALKSAIEQNVVYNNTSTNPTAGTRTFSISLGDANYLASTGHYYKFISADGILWTNAKTAAENTTYYGLQGYLATLGSSEEAQLCGEQATGTGWIGGSDAAQEGIWKWVTGPEAGTTFWNGGINGSTPNFAFWNNGEPNNANDEDYAHITAPGVGIPGSWNDLPNGGSGGQYAPKGYIVEFGGMPGDPVLQISATTTIDVVKLTGTTAAQRCGDGTLTLQGVSSGSLVYWYDAPTGGNLLATGSSFTTPSLSQTTTYYASAYPASCTTGTRTAVVATINTQPTTPNPDPVAPVCYGETAQLTATVTAGTLNWYDAPIGGTLLGTGSPFTTSPLTADSTFYAEAISNNCPATSRQAVTVNVLPLPEVTDEEVEFCEKTKVTITAGISGMVYEWSTGATTQSIEINKAGTYSVKVTGAGGCSAVKTITATTLPTADILRVEVNTDVATVIMTDPEVSHYVYSLDGGSYRDSNVFTNLSAGQHTVSVLSINGCGSDSMTFNVYMIPKFITPNGDNINDVFTIAGMSAYPEATINIFDRYGKIVAALSSRNRSWDGTFQGYRLPATDYWYIIKLTHDGEEIKGHFSLIR
ncbi:MAG: lectin [Flavobacterium psychrophilum]|nr:MAG: lectin [Flavobacterium psychrophilum]